MANDDSDRVRLPVYMQRKQRKAFHKMAIDLGTSASDYVLEAALERLAKDQQEQERKEAADDNPKS